MVLLTANRVTEEAVGVGATPVLVDSGVLFLYFIDLTHHWGFWISVSCSLLGGGLNNLPQLTLSSATWKQMVWRQDSLLRHTFF